MSLSRHKTKQISLLEDVISLSIKTRMWTDNETDEDLLGFSLHANLIGEIVTDPEMLPVTIGLG